MEEVPDDDDDGTFACWDCVVDRLGDESGDADMDGTEAEADCGGVVATGGREDDSGVDG